MPLPGHAGGRAHGLRRGGPVGVSTLAVVVRSSQQSALVAALALFIEG